MSKAALSSSVVWHPFLQLGRGQQRTIPPPAGEDALAQLEKWTSSHSWHAPVLICRHWVGWGTLFSRLRLSCQLDFLFSFPFVPWNYFSILFLLSTNPGGIRTTGDVSPRKVGGPAAPDRVASSEAWLNWADKNAGVQIFWHFALGVVLIVCT